MGQRGLVGFVILKISRLSASLAALERNLVTKYMFLRVSVAGPPNSNKIDDWPGEKKPPNTATVQRIFL